MTFEELQDQVKKIKCQEVRVHNENYSEVVVEKINLPAMISLLQSYFGPPLKAGGQKPTEEARLCSERYGGIQANQTLYYQKQDKSSRLALLWPWGNGESSTVKIVQESL